MSFLKFSRDRRGYEHFSLVEPVTGRRGKTRQRVLYWYRTPPNVKVGREPFDPHVMRALEVQYPGVKFDWQQLRNTPIPSVEPEYWRERRRAERLVRRTQEDEDAQTLAAEPPAPEAPAPESGATDPGPQELAEALGADGGSETPAALQNETPAALQNAVDSRDGASPRVEREGPGSRRGRRRRRGQRVPAVPGPPGSGETNQTESSAGASIDGGEVTEDEAVDGSDEE